MSGGRLEVGIGAGWNAPEYEAIGLAFDPPATRIERLGEAIAILRGCSASGRSASPGATTRSTTWTGNRSRSRNRTHRYSSAVPTSGSFDSLLRRETSSGSTSARTESISDAFGPRMDVRVGWVRDEAGDRFELLDLSVLRLLGDINIGRDALATAGDVARRIDDQTALTIRPEDILESPYA